MQAELAGGCALIVGFRQFKAVGGSMSLAISLKELLL